MHHMQKLQMERISMNSHMTMINVTEIALTLQVTFWLIGESNEKCIFWYKCFLLFVYWSFQIISCKQLNFLYQHRKSKWHKFVVKFMVSKFVDLKLFCFWLRPKPLFSNQDQALHCFYSSYVIWVQIFFTFIYFSSQ